MHQPPTTFLVNGQVARELRKNAGVELADMARRAQISRRYLSHIENGTRQRMRPAPYQRLRKELGANETELLLAPPETTPPEENPRAERQVPPIRPPHAAG